VGTQPSGLPPPTPKRCCSNFPRANDVCPPGPKSIREVIESSPSLYREGPPGTVAFSFEAKRSVAFRVGLSILTHRIQDRLRFELGLTYDVETFFIPLTADQVHVVIVSDATDQNVRRVSVEMLGALEAMAADGPSAEELQDELLDTRRYHSDPSEVPSKLFYSAAQHLLGAPDMSGRAILAVQERLEPAEVRTAIHEARQTLVAIVPEGIADLPGLAAYPMSAPHAVEGRRFRPPGLRLRRSASEPNLVLGETGVTLVLDDVRSTVAFDECVVALRYPDGSRTLLSTSGFFVGVDPRAWKDGNEAVAAIDAAVPEELVVLMEPALSERTDALEQIAPRG